MDSCGPLNPICWHLVYMSVTFSYSWPLQAISGEDKSFMDPGAELRARKAVVFNKSHSGGKADTGLHPKGSLGQTVAVLKDEQWWYQELGNTEKAVTPPVEKRGRWVRPGVNETKSWIQGLITDLPFRVWHDQHAFERLLLGCLVGERISRGWENTGRKQQSRWESKIAG